MCSFYYSRRTAAIESETQFYEAPAPAADRQASQPPKKEETRPIPPWTWTGYLV